MLLDHEYDQIQLLLRLCDFDRRLLDETFPRARLIIFFQPGEVSKFEDVLQLLRLEQAQVWLRF